jgi:hypothetical protein
MIHGKNLTWRIKAERGALAKVHRDGCLLWRRRVDTCDENPREGYAEGCTLPTS